MAQTQKQNPSAMYIGFSMSSTKPVTVNFRKGVQDQVECYSVKCLNANATGRRLTLTFHDSEGNEILSRRVYKEFFEKMAEKFECLLPE